MFQITTFLNVLLSPNIPHMFPVTDHYISSYRSLPITTDHYISVVPNGKYGLMQVFSSASLKNVKIAESLFTYETFIV